MHSSRGGGLEASLPSVVEDDVCALGCLPLEGCVYHMSAFAGHVNLKIHRTLSAFAAADVRKRMEQMHSFLVVVCS